MKPPRSQSLPAKAVTRSVDWRDPRDLLAALIRAMRAPAPVDENRAAKARAAIHYTAADFTREVEDAEAVLVELTGKVERLRALPLLRPDEYRKAWRTIIDDWNAELQRRRWQTLPALCSTCGAPVFNRRGERLKGGGLAPALVCSTKCADAAKKRTSRPAKD